MTKQAERLIAFRDRTNPYHRRYGIKTICCVCKRTRIGRHWIYNFYDRLIEKISHGYCPACMEKNNKLTREHLEGNPCA